MNRKKVEGCSLRFLERTELIGWKRGGVEETGRLTVARRDRGVIGEGPDEDASSEEDAAPTVRAEEW